MKLKKLISMLLCICMLVSLMPVYASAEGEPVVPEETVTEQDPPACEHDYVATETVDATCSQQGFTVYTCSLCGDSYNGDYTETVPHTPGDEIPAVAATCTSEGKTAGHVCSVCGAVADGCEPTPKADHTPVDVAEVAATCTVEGKTAGTRCSVCGEELSGFETIQKADHTPVDVSEVPATCTEAGKTAGKVCSICNAVLEGCAETDALGHDPVEVAEVPAEVGIAGTASGHVCGRCGEKLDGFEVIPALEEETEEESKLSYGPLTYTYTPKQDSSPEKLFEAYVESLFYPSARRRGAKSSSVVGSDLKGLDASLYSALIEQIALVAAGSRVSTVFEFPIENLGIDQTSWTAAELGVDSLVENGAISGKAVSAVLERVPFDLEKIVNALLADCPFELYWYDKTVETSLDVFGFATNYVNGEMFLCISGSFKFYLPVAAEFSAEEEYTVDPERSTAAGDACDNAHDIVDSNAGKSDFAKLVAYKNSIHELTGYNYDAAGGSVAYGNPWQLIWVFDGDDDTTVVCEGFSKAFQYLCEISTFSGNVTCVSVYGKMNGGNHMWNIVTMPDGKNYLADITNCEPSGDADTPLFFRGYDSGSVDEGYTYNSPYGNGILYIYDSSCLSTYGERLVMSSDTYAPQLDPCLNGHSYGTPTYVWAENNSKVTATRVCANNAAHTETETVETVYKETAVPTYESAGTGVYTATFQNTAFETQTKEVEIPKLEHTFTVTFIAPGGLFYNGTDTYTQGFEPGEGFYYDLMIPVHSDAHTAFTGWYYDAECKQPACNKHGNIWFTVTQDNTLYAGWTPGYSVILHGNGGFFPAINEQTQTVVIPKGDTLDGYWPVQADEQHQAFFGWYSHEDCAQEHLVWCRYEGEALTPAGDMELYAGWADGYTVTFDANTGYFGPQGVKTVTEFLSRIFWDTDSPEHSDPHKVFTGWYRDAAGQQRACTQDTGYLTLIQDEYFYAGWTDGYCVTFDANGGRFWDGRLVCSEAYLPGDSFCWDTNVPTLAGKEFTGWYYDQAFQQPACTGGSFTVSNDVTLYAGWTDGYVITFIGNGGTFWDGTNTRSETFAKNEWFYGSWDGFWPERDKTGNLVFSGWYSGSECREDQLVCGRFDSILIEENRTLYAGWTAGYYITLNGNGGYFWDEPQNTVITASVIQGESYMGWTPERPPEEHIVFNGWYSGSECRPDQLVCGREEEYVPTGNTTLYAGWATGYYITLMGNGGIFGSSADNNSSIRVTVLEGESFYGNWDGYWPWRPDTGGNLSNVVFSGWYSGSECRPEQLVCGRDGQYVPTGNTTLYAGWTAGYYITLIGNGGYFWDEPEILSYWFSVIQNDGFEWDSFLPVHSNIGWEFNGWYSDAACSTLVFDSGNYVPVENITLYAGWTDNSGSIIDYGTFGAQGNNLTWILDNTGTLTIRGRGDMPDYRETEYGNIPWYEYGSDISAVVIDWGVTGIGSNAFIGLRNLCSVTISENVTRIGDNAFNTCVALTSITIPAYVDSIGKDPFTSCYALSSITVDPGNTEFYSDGTALYTKDMQQIIHCVRTYSGVFVIPSTVTSVGWSAFRDCNNLSGITIPDSVRNIGENAFRGCNALTDVTIPSGVTSIGSYAFTECTNLAGIAIPASVSSIGDDVFAWCSSLTGITVASDNGTYCSGGGVLYTKDMQRLICCPGAYSGALDIPSGVTGIYNGAFCGCSGLTSVTIPSGVTNIGTAAFIACDGLTVITIPLSVTAIGSNAFTECTSLTDVHFNGSESQWNAIDISNEGNGPLLNASKHFLGYLITYVNIQTGDLNPNPEYYDGIKAVTLEDPSRVGYTFNGWYKEAGFKNKVTSIPKNTKAEYTVYAKWTANSYTIKFDGNGATSGSMSNLKATYGKSVTLTANAFKRTNYAFAGWNTKADGSGTSYKNKATVKNLKTSGTRTLYAQWTALYTIRFDGNGATSGSMSDMTKCKVGTSYTLTENAFKRRGYKFAGWNTKANGSGTAYENGASVKNLTKTAGGTRTLYAQWKKVKYTITYELNGGTNNNGNPASYYITTATITLKNPTRKGYTFKGWYSDSGLTKQVTEIAKGSTGSRTLYAKWAKTKYTITYNLNSGTNNSANPASYTITTATITLANPTRKGYTFKGWYSDSGLTKQVTEIAKGSVGNKTLYAKWAKTKYTITYNLNGGTNNSSNPASYTVTTATITLANPTRKGYTFKGWYSDSGLTKQVTEIPKGSIGNKTLYAKWVAKG